MPEESSLASKPTPWPPALRHLAVAVFYLALAVLLTWPVVLHIGSRYPGQGNDLILFPWQFWRLHRALQVGESPFYTTLLYHPHGVSLAFSNVPWALFALWLPLRLVSGPMVAHGILFFVALLGNGYAGYLLFRELLRDHVHTRLSPRWIEAAALLAGVILLARPWILSKNSHFSRMFQMGTPLAALCLLRYYRRGRWRDALGAAFWIAITGLIAWQHLVMGAAILGGLVLWRLVLQRPERWGKLLLHTALIAIAAGVVMAPFALLMLADLGTWEDPSDVVLDSSDSKQSDLVSFVAPPVGHPLQRLWTTDYYDRPRSAPFVGYVALALVAIGLVAHPRRAWYWGLMSAVCIVLALGSELQIDRRAFASVPMPYSWLTRSFLFAMIREPSRWNHTLTLPFSMAAAWGGVALLEALQRPRLRLAALTLTAALVAAEAWSTVFPYDTMEPYGPTWYETLAQEPGDFGILDLPSHDRYWDKWYMYYQITHGKPIVGGHVSRLPSEAMTYIEGSPWLREVADRDAMTMDPALTHVTRELAYLAEADVRYLILHREFADPEYIDAWADWLAIAPHADVGRTLVYHTDPQCERDYWLREELAPGVGLFGWDLGEERLRQGEALSVGVRWATCDAPNADYTARFTLRDAQGDDAAAWLRPPSDTIATDAWWDNEVVRGGYRLPVPLSVPPGSYRLELDLVDAATNTAQHAPVILGDVNIEPLTMPYRDEVVFGEKIALLGHDIRVLPDRIAVTLYWRALVAPANSYKFFVHVTADESGEIIAQHDAIPCGWACPTTLWETNEVAVDAIQLMVDDAPAHTIVVGLYHEHTLERLIPKGDATLAQDGTAIVLYDGEPH